MPVYRIGDFKSSIQKNDFYANTLKAHLEQHPMASVPHKHDFYLVAFFTKGSGEHEIDFVKYPIRSGQVFLMAPGQMHNWTYSPNADGYVFFHSKDFYDKGYTASGLKDIPLFNSSYSSPAIQITKKCILKLTPLFNELISEHIHHEPYKFEKLHSLLSLIYIELSRNYAPATKIENLNYLRKLRAMESLVDKYFKTKKYPHEYASLLNITEKHLNRIIKETLNKTTHTLISDRIILEAKRMLIHSRLSIKEIAFELGYEDYSYFSRFFKKHTSQTPVSFQSQYK